MNIFIVLCAFLSLSSAVHLSIKNEKHGKYCLILDSTINGQVQYNNIENETVTYNFVVNDTAVASGKCFDVYQSNTVEIMSIRFLPNDQAPEPPVKDPQWTIHLKFESPSDSTHSFKLVDYHLTAKFYSSFNASLPDNYTNVYHYSKTEDSSLEWGAADTHGFTCTKNSLALTNSSSIDFVNLKVIAFAMLDTDQFPGNQLFEQCKLDIRTSDLVPIIVGVCLAGLVIIVLIAYLIGRARAKRQGYASV